MEKNNFVKKKKKKKIFKKKKKEEFWVSLRIPVNKKNVSVVCLLPVPICKLKCNVLLPEINIELVQWEVYYYKW